MGPYLSLLPLTVLVLLYNLVLSVFVFILIYFEFEREEAHFVRSIVCRLKTVGLCFSNMHLHTIYHTHLPYHNSLDAYFLVEKE